MSHLATTWTLLCNGAEKTLAAWGIDAAAVTTGNQVVDTLRLNTGADYKGAALFPFGATVELYRNTAEGKRREFYGRVSRVPRQAGGGKYSTGYEAEGCWWYLQNKVYRELWPSVGAAKARAVLTYDETGTKMSAAQTLAKVLQYAIDAGAPFIVGDLSAVAGIMPAEEVKNLTCAEIVTRVLRWFPDVVLWFDYSTLLPTLNASRIATATVVDFSTASHVVERLSYTRRDDVRKDGVAIQYERIDVSDGVSTEVVISDTAGDVAGFNVLEATVSLSGAQVSFTKQYLRSETINHTGKEWLRDHIKELDGIALDKITVHGASIERSSSSLTREVIEGAHAEWMGGVSDTVTVFADIEYEVDGVKPRAVFPISLRATDKPTGNYSAVSSEVPSEPTPEGLAAQLFAALDRDHWEGSFTVVAQAPGRWDLIGKVIRMYDRAGALLFGPAQVQGVSVDLKTGTTAVNFGPTPILSAGDLVSLLRAARGRIAATSRTKMSSGGGSAKGAGEKTANNHTGQRPKYRHSIVVGTGESAKTVVVDLSIAPTLPDDLTSINITAREVQATCEDEDGRAGYRLVLCSDIYYKGGED